MTSGTPEEIEAEIAQQREELAATVSELQARLDVKAHAKGAVADAKASATAVATTDSGKPRPELIAAAAVLVVGVVALVVWRVRR